MNIQIFGKKKCFDTKKAERWFKERRIKFQQIDLVRFGMSGGEFDSVLRAVGGVDALIDWSVKSPEIDLMRYTDDKRAKEDKLFDHPELMKTPVVRNGKKAPRLAEAPEAGDKAASLGGEGNQTLCAAQAFIGFPHFSLLCGRGVCPPGSCPGRQTGF